MRGRKQNGIRRYPIAVSDLGVRSNFHAALQEYKLYKVGSLRSAIGLLAADVGTMGGQGGGPRRGARRHNA